VHDALVEAPNIRRTCPDIEPLNRVGARSRRHPRPTVRIGEKLVERLPEG
jgi:hypothetical protein